MCIAIVKTKDGKITDKELRNCFESNPDGAGIAYSKDGVLYMVKGIFDEDQFVEQYHKCEAEADGAMLIHCRISTSGNVDKINCHPHVVHDNCVMIHNGILDIDVPKDSKVSDTVIFVNDLLRPLPTDFMLDKGIVNMITHIIGKGNKFCFLNERGEYSIANEEAGHWKDGVWFSNYSYVSYGYASWGKKTKYGYTSYNTCYGGYDWEDEYDYYEDDDYYSLTDKESDKLMAVIEALTPEQLVSLGDNPVYDFYSSSLKRGEPKLRYCERYLEELDANIFDLYIDRYYQAVDDIAFLNDKYDLENVKTSDDLDEIVDGMEEWERYILTKYTIGTTDEDEELFDEINTDYSVKMSDYEFDGIDYGNMPYDENDEYIKLADIKEIADKFDEDGEVVDVDYSSDRTQTLKA